MNNRGSVRSSSGNEGLDKKRNVTANGPYGYFFTPSLPGSTKKTTSLFDDIVNGVTDSLGIKTKSNIENITKETLIENDITVAVLLEDIGVRLSEFKNAGILNSLQDLVDIGFDPCDLTRDRLLFSCATLYQLFGNYDWWFSFS